jgi:hypothetical protein
METQYRGVCVRANMLIRRFPACDENVYAYLFKPYCTTMYCSALWVSHNRSALNKLRILYNNAYRWLMKQPRRTSASQMFVTDKISTFNALRHNDIYGVFSRLPPSNNSVVVPAMQNAMHSSIMLKYWTYALRT